MRGKDRIPSNTQQWFSNYGRTLAASYQSSRLIKHKPTKGGTREDQVLTFFHNLLPKCCAVERNVVITDCHDRQTAKFDGALVDRWSWPLLLAEGGVTIAPVESVVVALEVKSTLERKETRDIFKKARSLRELIADSDRPPRRAPKTAAFAYGCTNPNLAFLDYAVAVHDSGFHSPNSICVLGSVLMAVGRERDGTITVTEDWDQHSVPVLIRCGEDALLLFFCLLSSWATDDADASSSFMRYAKAAFATENVFYFHQDFLEALATAPARLKTTRDLFKRRATAEIEELYQESH